MMDALWHVALMAANLWGTGGVDGLGEARTEYRVDVRTESGPPILSQIPYVNRLFRNVGWSQYVTPVLPPLKPGVRPEAEEPSRAEIIRALPKLTCIEGFYEEFRDNVSMTFEKLVDRVDPPRFYPVIGPAQLHQVHWKCMVYYTETIQASFPFAFRTSRKRTEVVYIDKDHLHLCQSEKDDAEPQEIRALPAPMARPAKQTAVQLDIVVAKINRSARPDLGYPWANSTKNWVRVTPEGNLPLDKSDVPFGIAADPKAALNFLHKLRDEGVLKFVAEPSVTTLSGRPVCFESGAQVSVTTQDSMGVSSTFYQVVGTTVKATATLMKDGKIFLEVRPEITTLNPATGAANVPGFDVRSCQVTVAVKDGQTVAIGGLVTQEESETVKLVPLLSDLPLVGQHFKLKVREGINEDTVILVTPRLVEPCACEAEDAKPDTRVVACWENRSGSLVGSVYLFSEETKRPIAAAGRIEVQAFDMAPALKGEEPRLLAQWTFHPDMLEKLQRKDLIGAGYALTVNWADMPADVANIKLQTVYLPAQGASRSDEPTYVARRGEDTRENLVQQPPLKFVPAQAVSNKRGNPELTLPEVLRLVKAGVDTRVIMRQIDLMGFAADSRITLADVMLLSSQGRTEIAPKLISLTNSVFNLSVDDIIYLCENNVPFTVIMAMQDTMRKWPAKSP